MSLKLHLNSSIPGEANFRLNLLGIIDNFEFLVIAFLTDIIFCYVPAYLQLFFIRVCLVFRRMDNTWNRK